MKKLALLISLLSLTFTLSAYGNSPADEQPSKLTLSYHIDEFADLSIVGNDDLFFDLGRGDTRKVLQIVSDTNIPRAVMRATYTGYLTHADNKNHTVPYTLKYTGQGEGDLQNMTLTKNIPCGQHTHHLSLEFDTGAAASVPPGKYVGNITFEIKSIS